MSEFVLDFFEGKNLATIEKKKHSYLMIDGHDQADIYILKDGIVKTSIILSDGREFNIMYLKGFDVLSLLKDEIKKVTSASFHIRIESDTDKDATEKNRQSIIDQRKDDLYKKVLSGWQKDDGWKVVKKALAKIEFSNSLTQQDPNASTESEESTE